MKGMVKGLKKEIKELKKRVAYSDRNFQLALAELRKLDPKYYGKQNHPRFVYGLSYFLTRVFPNKEYAIL